MDGGKNALFSVTKDEICGRFIVAARNLKQGQLIFKESPVFLCQQLGNPIICFNCCAQLSKLQFCAECAAAVLCNPNCTGRFHDPQECATLKSSPIKREHLISNPEVIPFLRCLLWRRYNNPLFERLLQLESHLEARRDTEIWRRTRTNVEEVLHGLGCIDETDLREEIVQQVCGILDINTFDVRQPQENRTGFGPSENLRGLFLTAAMMGHDCVANAHLAVGDDFVLYVRAAVDIPEGCPIFFNYTNLLQGNEVRGCRLGEGKNFECQCPRCLDPTELGTELSTIKCPRCHQGLLRPKDWACTSCKRPYHKSLVKIIVTEARRRIDAIDKPDIETLEQLIRKLVRTFHPHHYFVLELEQNLVRFYAQDAQTVENLRRRIELCSKLLEIFEKLEPGISRIQAIALYELHSAVAGLAQKNHSSKEITQKEFLEKLLQAENLLKRSVKFLIYEPKNSPEGRLAQNAMSELRMLRLAIANLQDHKPKKGSKEKNKHIKT